MMQVQECAVPLHPVMPELLETFAKTTVDRLAAAVDIGMVWALHGILPLFMHPQSTAHRTARREM